MKIKRALWRYIKGAVLFPYYMKRVHEITVDGACGRSASGEAERIKHAAIFKDIERCGGIRTGDLLAISDIRVHVNPPRTIETINEVLIRQDYEFFEGDSSFVMIDVGMNVGITSLAKAVNPKYVKVYGFEPLKPTFDLARKNINLNPHIKDKISAHNFGLSNKNEEIHVKFTLDDIMSISSEATFDSCFGSGITDEIIQVRRASDVVAPILERHKTDKIFLKIDCEGAEYKIMADLDESRLIKDVHAMIIEWHNRESDDLLEILERNGFVYFIERINVEWNVGLIRAISARSMAEWNPVRDSQSSRASNPIGREFANDQQSVSA